MFRKIAGWVIAVIAGGIAVMLIQLISATIFPAPKDLDFADKEAMKAFIETLPLVAFVIVIFSHFLGALVAGVVCTKIVGHRWLPGIVGLGMFFFCAGVSNLVTIPHPLWFAIVDLTTYFPGVILGMRLAAPASSVNPNTEESPTEA